MSEKVILDFSAKKLLLTICSIVGLDEITLYTTMAGLVPTTNTLYEIPIHFEDKRQ